MTDLSHVNRVEIVDFFGRTYRSFNADQVHVYVQDEGRTLKVTHSGDTAHGVEYPGEAPDADAT